MIYKIGLMDIYPIVAAGTILENEPMFKMTMKNEVDPIKLEDALYRAIKFHPLFGTQVRFDKDYYLETNNRPIILVNSEEKERPLSFGINTNGYPWQVCYHDKTIIFEWCHGVTDGMGAFEFVKTFISIYCGVEYNDVPKKMILEPGLEPFVDNAEQGRDFEADPKGFNIVHMPIYKRGYKTDCHVINGQGEKLVKIAKENNTSPACLLAILLSKAIRKHLPSAIANKKVAVNVVMNLRKPLEHETMHNCVEYKRMTYLDEYDKLSLKEVGKIYKNKLDVARRKENVVRLITSRVKLFKVVFFIKIKQVQKFMVSLASLTKNTECNCVVTYVGKFNPDAKVKKEMENIEFRVWHDFGQCTIAAIDYDGKFNINLCENYLEKGIAEDFIKLCNELGMDFVNTDNLEYEQIKLIEETK